MYEKDVFFNINNKINELHEVYVAEKLYSKRHDFKVVGITAFLFFFVSFFMLGGGGS